MKRFCLSGCAAATILLAGCSFVEEPQGEEMLVIEARITSGGFPTVTLTRTAPVADGEEIPLSQIVPRWATVELSDGTSTYTLTGRYDSSAFPPFVYDTYELRGKPGATYTITATDKNLRLTARATIPTAVPAISGVELQRVEGSDSLVSGALRFSLPLSADTLHVMAWVCDHSCDGRSFYPGFLSMMKTTGGDGLRIPVNRGKHRDDMESFSPNFRLDDLVDVILGVVDRDVYDYWERFQNNVYFSGGAFLSPSVSGADRVNVAEGGLGVFSAAAADYISFKVAPE